MMRAFAVALLAALPLLPPGPTRDGPDAGSGCPADPAGAQPFGPAFSAADSGRVYASVLSADMRELYFFKKTGTGEDYRLFRSRRAPQGWSAPESLPMGGNFSDLYPSLSPDGQRLVFASYRPAPGDTAAHHNAYLWMARRTGTGWSPPSFLPASRLGWYHSGLRQDARGTVHLRLTSPDWRETVPAQLRWSGTAYADSLEPAPETATEYWRAHLGDSLFVWGEVAGAGDGFLVQVSRVDSAMRRGPGRYFWTARQGNSWSPLVPSGGGLGEGAPNFAWFSPDGCYIHYTRNYAGFVRVPLAAVRQAGAGGTLPE